MATEDYKGTFLAVCACGNVLQCEQPHDCTCRCGNYIPAGMFGPEETKRRVTIKGFRGEDIVCYQPD